jgi:hypothetical protein
MPGGFTRAYRLAHAHRVRETYQQQNRHEGEKMRRKMTQAEHDAMSRADEEAPRGAAGMALALVLLVAFAILIAAPIVAVVLVR